MSIDISIISVTYNNQDTIDAFLSSLLKKIPDRCEVIIVDNNSEDKTTEELKKYKNIKLIEEKNNLGFAKACNVAVRLAKGNYLLFLNPDTEVLDDSISRLFKFITSDLSIGIVVPKLLLPDGKIQNSVRMLPTLFGAIKEYIFGARFAYSEYTPKSPGPLEIESAYGAAILIKKELFEKMKGFDERYFLYYEDLDLCRRIRNLGLKVIYLPEAVFKHQVGASSIKAETVNIPLFSRIISNFIPIKQTGNYYYQLKSANIYHGFVNAFLIHLVVYVSLKLKLHVFR